MHTWSEKSLEYFKQFESNNAKQSKVFTKYLRMHNNVQKASYEVEKFISKSMKFLKQLQNWSFYFRARSFTKKEFKKYFPQTILFRILYVRFYQKYRIENNIPSHLKK